MPKIIIEPESPEELKTLVKGAIENEKKIITIGLKKTMESLRELEDRFKMDTETFHKKYSTGELGDNIEYIRWAGEIETLKRLEKSLKDLHFKDIESFPHHKHEGEKKVVASKEPSLRKVLYEIEKIILQ